MRNIGTILLSAGILFVSFTLLTPLLFFFIDLLLEKSGDGAALLEMKYTFLSMAGLMLLVLGSVRSSKFPATIIVSSIVATLALVLSFFASDPRHVFDWIVIGCYYISLLIAVSVGIALLHTANT